MADRTELFPITVPAHTPQATPLVTSLSFHEGDVAVLEFIIPPGPSGLLGWQVLYSGQVIIPRGGAGFFVMDDTHESWQLEKYPTGGGWQIAAYNTDVYPHLLQFILHVNELQPIPSTTIPLIPLG